MTTVVIIAKECVPGRVKTRLSPPFSLEEAARIAAASLDDVIAAVAALPASRRVLCFAGDRVPDLASALGFDVIPQGEGSLDERLARLFDEMTGPTLLVGMDTPQLAAHQVAAVFGTPAAGDPAFDAWLGGATDGGFWALWMRAPRGDVIRGVPMSRPDTGAVQLARLRDAGLAVGALPVLTDVDTMDSAAAVAAAAPGTRFASEYRRLAQGASRAGAGS
ncbi:TIGR04282 family arsenosugar biosynthesis glycosyltransferase [Agromyces salentinus]|uniref:DUF2064 domain-containing protein n=1 Tax=Agromyces salentinus TaxID=269421 RepID=A0ABP4Z3A7_9MICO|nr:DUF2064 domain-containing protein [Agromyces salentinus]